MDRGAWQAAVHGVANSRTRLSNFTFTFHFHALEEMATHSSVLAWRIPGTGEPGGLLPMGSHRVGHDWSDLAAAFQIRRVGRQQAWGLLLVFGAHASRLLVTLQYVQCYILCNTIKYNKIVTYKKVPKKAPNC